MPSACGRRLERQDEGKVVIKVRGTSLTSGIVDLSHMGKPMVLLKVDSDGYDLWNQESNSRLLINDVYDLDGWELAEKVDQEELSNYENRMRMSNLVTLSWGHPW